MKTNVARPPVYTHEGARADRSTPLAELERAVLACLLWEDTFYEAGEDIAARILRLSAQVSEHEVAKLAVKARSEYHLRHVPLLLLVALAQKTSPSPVTSKTIEAVIQRADEMGELCSLWWKLNGRARPKGKSGYLTAQIKKGLRKAFPKFDAYQLAKYNRDTEVKLRDILFMVHPKPKDEAQQAVWDKLVNGTLEAPDTWEVNLSAGADKRETFTRLITEKKLGYMALLRNLRNMDEAGVDRTLVENALIEGAPKSRALPFRFIAAVRNAPSYASALDKAMQIAISNMEPLEGRTVICVDVSGSMDAQLSGKSTMRLNEAAAGIAILLRGMCPSTRIIGFGTNAQEIPAYNGLAIADYLRHFGREMGYGTEIRKATMLANTKGYDRIIVVTDMQSSDGVATPLPGTSAYIVNVAPYQYGIGYGRWTHINGFSDSVVRYMQEIERHGTG